MSTGERRILCVGLCCLDIITVCDGYPEEDTDQKCLDQLWQRGGNASNSCTAVSLVGQPAEFLGVITDSKEQMFLSDDLVSYGIRADHCVHLSDLQTPSATIISNIQNASRTILACQRKLPEVTINDFKKINLGENKYKWIHFEGRPSVPEIKQMLQHVDNYNSSLDPGSSNRIRTSVELEKRRENLTELFDTTDVVFISKEFSQWKGCSSMTEAVETLVTKCRPGAVIICPWGDKGAAARSLDGKVTLTCPAFPPDALVDTLAAGDTFNGATISALSAGVELERAITFGCRVAGAKCGMRGWKGMAEAIASIKKDMHL